VTAQAPFSYKIRVVALVSISEHYSVAKIKGTGPNEIKAWVISDHI
jgi:hypothetical protein